MTKALILLLCHMKWQYCGFHLDIGILDITAFCLQLLGTDCLLVTLNLCTSLHMTLLLSAMPFHCSRTALRVWHAPCTPPQEYWGYSVSENVLTVVYTFVAGCWCNVALFNNGHPTIFMLSQPPNASWISDTPITLFFDSQKVFAPPWDQVIHTLALKVWAWPQLPTVLHKLHISICIEVLLMHHWLFSGVQISIARVWIISSHGQMSW